MGEALLPVWTDAELSAPPVFLSVVVVDVVPEVVGDALDVACDVVLGVEVALGVPDDGSAAAVAWPDDGSAGGVAPALHADSINPTATALTPARERLRWRALGEVGRQVTACPARGAEGG